MPDFRRYVIDTDVFTPKTIRRFTWHDNGAVYGAPDKQLDGPICQMFFSAEPIRVSLALWEQSSVESAWRIVIA